MKIIINRWMDGDDLERQQLNIDGKEYQYVGPLCDCPEDAIIGRDLVSCDDIVSYMKMGYAAAKRGEDLDIEVVEGDPE